MIQKNKKEQVSQQPSFLFEEALTNEDNQNQAEAATDQFYDEMFFQDILNKACQTYNHSNAQGYLMLLNQQQERFNLNQSQPSNLKDLNSFLSANDFSALRSNWGQDFNQKINFILSNWQCFLHTHKHPLKKFIQALHYPDIFKSLYKEVYPGLVQTIKKLEIKLQLKDSTRQMETRAIRSKSNDKFYQYYIQELESRANKGGSFYVNEDVNRQDPNKEAKMPIGSYIVKNDLFLENTFNWKLIFFISQATKKFDKEKTSFEDIKEEIDTAYSFANLLLQNNQLTQSCNQICCAKFFYLNFNLAAIQNINILCRSQLSKLFENSQNARKKIQLQDTMLDVCSLLNRGGGVVLFNTERTYLEVHAYGESIIEQQMKKTKKLVQNDLKKIYPKVRINQQVSITFVPLVKNPYEHGFKRQVIDENSKRSQRKYIKGLFVMRITVIPSEKQKLYYYLPDSLKKSQIKTAIVEGGKRINISGPQVLFQMKRKFQFFNLDGQQQEEQQLLGHDFTYMDKAHQCSKPYQGLLMRDWPGPQPVVPLVGQNNYKYMSLLIAPQKQYGTIKKRIERKGIDCYLETMIQRKYKFKSAVNSVPIFHNIRFDQLHTHIAFKPQFQFDGRFALLINVTTYIKFIHRINDKTLNRNDYNSLQLWLKKAFQNQKLQYWTFQTKDNNDLAVKQHYLKTQSKLSMVFMYYVLHHFNEKTLFKDPKEKGLSKEQIQKKMSKVYPITWQNQVNTAA